MTELGDLVAQANAMACDSCDHAPEIRQAVLATGKVKLAKQSVIKSVILGLSFEGKPKLCLL